MTSAPHADPGPPRVVELFGPSSGGKSSLGARLVAEGRAVLHTTCVLESAGLGFLPGHALRTLALDAIALGEVVRSWRRQRDCYARAATQALRGAGPRGPLLRLMLLRNAWKGAALRVRVARVARPGQLVLMDEGPLQTVNYLFVHADAEPAHEALGAFLATLPLPDAALYVRADEEALVARTLRRSHARVPLGSREAARRFVRHALEVFDRIAAEPRVRERLITPEALLVSAGPAPREACA